MRKRENLNTKGNFYPKMSNITLKWVTLLLPFTSNYGGKLFEMELARLSNIPQQTASRYLKDLVKQNILSYTNQGRNKLFYFDYSNPTARVVLEIIENSKALIFQQNVDEASLIVNEMLKYSDSIVVFGSYASYSFNESSDLDVVVVGKSKKEEIRKIKQKQTIEINVHYISYEEFAKILKSKNPLALEIFKNHILFGNVSRIVGIFIEAMP